MKRGGLFSFKKSARPLALLTSTFLSSVASAQEINSELIDANMAMDSAPLIIGIGALAFSVVAMIWLGRARKASAHTQQTGSHQVAQLRAELDEYEELLACMPEVTLLWPHKRNPQLFGKPQFLGTPNMGLVELLNFEGWLVATDAFKLTTGLKLLHSEGREFSISVRTKTGQTVRAVGRATGDTVIVRLRNATASPPGIGFGESSDPNVNILAVKSVENTRTVLALLSSPAWIRNSVGDMVYANKSYMDLCTKLNITDAAGQVPDLFSTAQVNQHLLALGDNSTHAHLTGPLPGLTNHMHLKLSRIDGASLGILTPEAQSSSAVSSSDLHQVMNAMSNPIAMFDADGRLTQFNSAYQNMFAFDQKWLSAGLNEREIIDDLRRRDMLPAVPDYRVWRTEHLAAYSLKAQRTEIWHLRDGRSLEIIAIPNTKSGGVIYTFEDKTEQLRLQTSNKSMLNVQRETLNALSEGVAVFGTDGRLRLHNPLLSNIWKLPMNQLGLSPHIDQIAEACGQAIPADGEDIWRQLKTNVLDLDPGRTDKMGRIQLKDGRLIDYTIVRLGDSQTMLTFVDVTNSANYENVLKERNDALVTADRLKDAFVQNVSYELRSPLTSIIGFADLLASDNFGPLTDQQRSYTDYIRSSSATLGMLIDNILDLTNVDAGIAELDLHEHDVEVLIEKARAGFAATLVSSDGAEPLNLKVSLPDSKPKFVADGARVVQILYNLLSNAAKFSEPGAPITLIVEENGDWLRFIIQDEGVGIPTEIQNTINGGDAERSLKGLQRGAGIGLLIVKAFVEMHDGSISTRSNAKHGNQVIVNLPLNASIVADGTAPKQQEAK